MSYLPVSHTVYLAPAATPPHDRALPASREYRKIDN